MSFIVKEEFNSLTFPQVTQVIRTIFTYNGFISQANKEASERALNIGTITHEALNAIEESMLKKQSMTNNKSKLLDSTSEIIMENYIPMVYDETWKDEKVSSTVEHCVNQFIKWRHKNIDWELVVGEQPIKHGVTIPFLTQSVSYQCNYRGIIDAIYKKPDNSYALVDYKTSARISDEYMVQLMAYYISLPTEIYQKTKEVAILRIDKKSKIVDYAGTTPLNSPVSIYAEKIFTHALESYYLKEILRSEMISFKIGD